MKKELAVAGVAIVGGYVVGALSGYRAAVRDYVENDGEQLDKMANSMYSQQNEAAPANMAELVEQVEQDADGDGSHAFQ